MKITLQAQENVHNLMRRCGYFSVRPSVASAKEGTELAFIRPVSSSGSGYPRFHVYVKINGVSHGTLINLHLDQKKPIYQATGVAAHSGEYEGEIVEKEAERIRKILGL